MIFEYGRSILEALLFASPEPLSLKRLSGLTGLEEKAVRALLEELRQDYDRGGRGLTLLEIAGGFQLATRAEFDEYVARLFPDRQQAGLSRAALETLAVVAYNQPATRAEVEHIRGVASDRSLATLVDKGLLQEAGRRDAPGRPILYATTPLFLQHFGLKDLAELPRLDDFPVSIDALEQSLLAAAGGAPSSAADNSRPAADPAEKDRSQASD
ncbi:MAG: SMC-Scp complex subunit ScpB [Bacillota bacterium]